MDSENDFAFIFNIDVTCTDEPSIGDPDLNTFADGASHSAYCVSGLPATDNFDPNGEYVDRTDIDGYDELFTNLEGAYEKNDPNGRAYIFEIRDDTDPALVGTNMEQWIISKSLGSPVVVSDIVAKCPPGDSLTESEFHQTCPSFVDANDAPISGTITPGICEAQTVIGSVFGLFPKDMQGIKIFILLIGVAVFGCIIGMMTCYCCQIICGCGKTKDYDKVSNKEVDIDF